jgi:hypothetical protein
MSTTRMMIEETLAGGRGGLSGASEFWLSEIWAYAVEINHTGWRRLIEAEWRRRGLVRGTDLEG